MGGIAGVTTVWDDAAAAAAMLLLAAATEVLSMEEEAAVGLMFVFDEAEPNAVHTDGVLLVLLVLLLLLLCRVAFTVVSLPSVRIEEFVVVAASTGGLNDVYKLD